MRPERMAELVVRWARCYSLGLPDEVRERRVAELTADLHDQIAHERDRGVSERRIALSILSRMVRGVAADGSWRTEHASAAHRSLTGILLATAVLLAIPLLAMQITDEVAWGPFDFAVAGTLIAGTGLLGRAALRRARDLTYRAAAGVALAALFALLWGNLAMGMVGEPDESANALYLGVLAVAVFGAIAVRFQPQGMARVLLATAAVQTVVAAMVLIAGEHEATGTSALEVVALNGFFATLFVASAVLFRRAAVEQTPARTSVPE